MDNHTKKQHLKELLKIHYGYDDFRPGQEEAIDNVLDGQDTVVIMPTGGGKSLIYQLPSLILGGTTFVISPLISLMKDQVDALNKIGIPATFINSSINTSEAAKRIQAVKNGAIKLLYIAPERFYNQYFIESLKDIKVGLFAVDEAHCISAWGHDFRPSYTKLKNAIDLLGRPPVIALTATATPEVRQDIIKQLGLNAPKVIITGFARPNLQFGVMRVPESQKGEIVLRAVENARGGSGIIYVGTRATADGLVQDLLDNNIEAASYHAGMDGESRKWIQDSFLSGRVKVIVATNAFGMGIDKADIRFVIHYNMPRTIEAYYQEVGRAGRDGRPSFCLMLYSPQDRYLQEFFIKGDNPSPNIIKNIYKILIEAENDTVLLTYADLKEALSENVPEMAIGTSLKILEKEGYISRPREKSSQAFLQLNQNLNAIKVFLGPRARKSQAMLDKLYKHFSQELEQGWHFNLDEAAQIIKEKKDALSRLIRKLANNNLVQYEPPFRGSEINILKRVSPNNLEIDFASLKEKHQSAYEKLDKMEEYVYCPGCRQEYILKYFEDRGAHTCGKCDNCLTGFRTSHYEHPKRFKSKVPKPKEIEIKPANKKSPLNTKLTQLETFELYNQGLSIEEIALKRDLKPSTVVTHISYLIEKGIIKEIDNLVSTRKQKKIIKAARKIGSYDKLAPIKEILGDEISWEDLKFVVAKLRYEKR